MSSFYNPCSLEEALGLLAEARDPSGPGRLVPVAGGSDVMVRLQLGRLKAESFVSLMRVRARPEDTPVARVGEDLIVDALAPLSQLIQDPLLVARCRPLVEAMKTIGSPQVRNVATLGGNIANASPAADSVPSLLVDEAQVTLASAKGTRVLPLAELLLGPGRTALRGDELITLLRLKPPAKGRGFQMDLFKKFGKRRANIIASANIAARAGLDESESLQTLRIAVGGVGPRARRLEALEALLLGARIAPGHSFFDEGEAAILAAIDEVVRPISDVRGSLGFKRALIVHAIEGLAASLAARDASVGAPAGVLDATKEAML